jgi:ligand-binding SRPBCC domain-containing protein
MSHTYSTILQAFKHTFVVNSYIDRVWEFYTDINHLEIITPSEMKLKVTNATSQKLSQGSEIWLEGKLMISMRRWHSIIKSLSPYQYVNELLTGLFKMWRHSHKFYALNINNNQKQTEVIDEVYFEIPYGPIGKLFEAYAYSRIKKLFDHRKAATIRALEDNT